MAPSPLVGSLPHKLGHVIDEKEKIALDVLFHSMSEYNSRYDNRKESRAGCVTIPTHESVILPVQAEPELLFPTPTGAW
jgi:hypothetical protein